jgi:predicted transcriptional regulator
MNKQNHQFTVRLDKEIFAQFIAYSRRKDTTMSVIIRDLINQLLDNEEKTKAELLH